MLHEPNVWSGLSRGYRHHPFVPSQVTSISSLPNKRLSFLRFQLCLTPQVLKRARRVSLRVHNKPFIRKARNALNGSEQSTWLNVLSAEQKLARRRKDGK